MDLAGSVVTLTMRACATTARTNVAWRAPSIRMSSRYRVFPVSMAGSSLRSTGCPRIEPRMDVMRWLETMASKSAVLLVRVEREDTFFYRRANVALGGDNRL